MAFQRFPIGGPVQPVKIAAPYAFASCGLGLQIFLRVRFKGSAAGFVTKPVTVPQEVGDQACTAGVDLHAANRVHMNAFGGCCFFHV